MRERVTIGCLVLVNVLLLAPFVLAAYLWFSFERAERENDRRREAAADSLLARARDAADRTAGALTASRDTGTDALLDVILRHTGGPVIAYDEDGRVFTAVASRSAEYEWERVPFGDPGVVERCFAYTYTHVRRPGPAWTPEVAERDGAACQGSSAVGSGVRSAQAEMEGLDAAQLTRAGLQEALDPGLLPGEKSGSEVRSTVRKGRTVVALVLFREQSRFPDSRFPDDGAAPAEQCYRLTRVLDPEGGAGGSVTAAPVTEC
ncbi:hypothetical protein WJ438_26140 [Streptomyces sp. GD-15H]|uniref:hypothetical protein n=1 Tax=Streptomyces sp. GD-15H TaxID=3129112 RepID=UPI00324A504A